MLDRLKRTRAIRVGGIVFLVALLSALAAPLLTPEGASAQHLDQIFQPPGSTWPLGTDEYGRDLLARTLWGGRWSLLVGLTATALGGVSGALLGLMAGFWGGWFDRVVSATVNLLMSFPSVMIGVIAAGILGSGFTAVVGAIAISIVPRFARVARGEVLSIREREYVLAAKASGVKDVVILFQHLIPNSASALIIMFTLYFPYAILVESSLSFLGIGMPADAATWGRVVADGRQYLRLAPWISLFPGLMIMATSLGLNVLGDGLRDALDPKLYTGGTTSA